MLASEEEQLEYERKVPHVDITAELICGWFDDSYHPGHETFDSCFSKDELKVLASFNQIFERIEPTLPKSRGTVKTWLADSQWRQIMQAASQALSSIGG